MKWVQIGILAALIVVAGLLFQIYRTRQAERQSAAVVVEPSQRSFSHSEAQPETPPAPPSAAPKTESRPAPAVSAKSTAAPGRSRPAKPETLPAERPAAEAGPPAPPPPASQPEPQPTAQLKEPEPPAAPAPTPAPAPAPAPPRTVTIASGTLISVRLAETLSSDRLKEGDSFMATLDRPLVADGLVIAERGARVEGRVLEAQQAGRVRGVSALAIRLTSITTSDGQRVEIETDPFRKEGETTRGEDAAKVGGGAGLGAAIGAIAGGGKGAAIGAAIGAAAGAGTVAATRGKAAVLPVETRLDFRLSRPVTVTERR